MTTRWPWIWPLMGGLLVISIGFGFYQTSKLGTRHFFHSNLSDKHDEDHQVTSGQSGGQKDHHDLPDGLTKASSSKSPIVQPVVKKTPPSTETKKGKLEHTVVFTATTYLDGRMSIAVYDSIAANFVAQDFLGRTYWCISATTCVVFMLFTGMVAGHVIYRTLTGYPSGHCKKVCWITGLTCLLPVVILPWFDKPVGMHAVRDIIMMLQGTSGIELLGRVGNGLFGMSIAVAIAVMVACSLTVAVPPPQVSEDAELLTVKANRLQLLLYTCAALLVVGVIELHALLRWLSAYALQGDLGKLIDEVAAGTASALGVFGTLLLVSVYLPAAAVLQIRKHALGADGRPESDQSKHWSLRQGLYGSPLQLFGRGAAILAPILIGVLGMLFKN